MFKFMNLLSFICIKPAYAWLNPSCLFLFITFPCNDAIDNILKSFFEVRPNSLLRLKEAKTRNPQRKHWPGPVTYTSYLNWAKWKGCYFFKIKMSSSAAAPTLALIAQGTFNYYFPLWKLQLPWWNPLSSAALSFRTRTRPTGVAIASTWSWTRSMIPTRGPDR